MVSNLQCTQKNQEGMGVNLHKVAEQIAVIENTLWDRELHELSDLTTEWNTFYLMKKHLWHAGKYGEDSERTTDNGGRGMDKQHRLTTG